LLSKFAFNFNLRCCTEAERRKRATVLESEAERESAVNRAEGMKQRVILVGRCRLTL